MNVPISPIWHPEAFYALRENSKRAGADTAATKIIAGEPLNRLELSALRDAVQAQLKQASLLEGAQRYTALLNEVTAGLKVAGA